jgi:hypothetical protein
MDRYGDLFLTASRSTGPVPQSVAPLPSENIFGRSPGSSYLESNPHASSLPFLVSAARLRVKHSRDELRFTLLDRRSSPGDPAFFPKQTDAKRSEDQARLRLEKLARDRNQSSQCQRAHTGAQARRYGAPVCAGGHALSGFVGRKQS